MTAILWNQAFTSMIRVERPSLWTNWTLNSAIQVGAIGYTDPETGDFTPYDTLQTSPLKRYSESQTWQIMSTNVKKSGGTADISAKYDPTSGKEVTVEASATWSFTESGQIVSKFQPVNKIHLDNRGNTMQLQMDQISNVAKSNGFMSGKDITQGFGVITEVIYAEAGMNIGAQTSGSSFTLKGSVDGMAGMTDSDQAHGSLKGSYFSESSQGSVSSHIWPSSADEVSTANAPVAFVVSSFGPGNMIIPVWVNPLSEFTLQFDNQHGGTYICHVTVTGEVDGKVKTFGTPAVSGGSSKMVTGIPLNVLNLTAKLDFESGPTNTQTWGTPLTQIPSGDLLIDIFGVSPNTPSYTVHVVPPQN